MQVHEKSQGYREGVKDYVKGRPGYPPETEAWLRETLGINQNSKVLEVGAGTGKFIPTLRETGAQITAVEPIAEMRDELQRAYPDVLALDGAAEAIPLPDASVDAVICAQAFHWFATSAALADMARVLVRGGMLGLIWNGRDETIPWVAELSEITNRYEGNTPRYRTGAWRKAFPAPDFEPASERHVRNAHIGSAEEVVLKRTMSVSFIAGLPSDERAALERDIRALIDRTPVLREKRVSGKDPSVVRLHQTLSPRAKSNGVGHRIFHTA